MKKDQALQNLVDLGLMTRILCHEINNLLASQQGFLKLLGRGAPNPEITARWNGEVLAANQELQDLVKSVQSLIHSNAFEEEIGLSPTYDQLLNLAEESIHQGANIPHLALIRILSITTHQLYEIDQVPREWSFKHASGPVPNSFLEAMNQAQPLLCLCTSIQPSDALYRELDNAAGRILPPKNSTPREWRWALVLGLLRQSQGDIRLQEDLDPSGLPVMKCELWLPLI